MIVKQKTVKKAHKKVAPKETISKVFNRCAKALKINLVLKVTKKLQEIGEPGDDAQKLEKKEKLLAKLKAYKSLDHQKIGQLLAVKKFPTHFEDESEATLSEGIDGEALNTILSNKKVDECVTDIKKLLNRSSSEGKREKRENREDRPTNPTNKKRDFRASSEGESANPDLEQALRAKKSKLSHAGKIAKKKAVFMDSLNGESDENGQDVDEYEKSKIEKSIRNRQNRAKNRALREQEQKEQMAIYGPGAEQKHDDIRQEYGGRSIRKVARDRPRFSSSGSGNNSGRPQERPARRPILNVPPPTLVVATKPIIENAKKDELTFMAKSGKEWKETGVHPSWAAKKINQTAAIIPSQGKKIVFDD